jgi:hypothetical protein
VAASPDHVAGLRYAAGSRDGIGPAVERSGWIEAGIVERIRDGGLVTLDLEEDLAVLGEEDAVIPLVVIPMRIDEDEHPKT